MFSKKPYCLILSGGGTKGVYHIGVWKALKELKIPINAFIGNSIGSIISAFLAQNDAQFLEKTFKTIDLEAVLHIPDSLKKNGSLALTKNNLESFKDFFLKLTQNRGFDTSPFRQLIETQLDEEKIRKSGNDLGMTTFNLSTLHPDEVFLEDLKPGHLIDYLMASSALPGFVSPEINGKKFMDGGVYNNIPYNMARNRGYRRLIVSDMSGLGITQKMNYQGANIIYIRNSIKMGGALNFDPHFLSQFFELGYLDTLKTFDELTGRLYFLLPEPKIEQSFKNFLNKPDSLKKTQHLLQNLLNNTQNHIDLKSIFPEENRHEKNALMILVDSAATILELKRIRTYTYKEMIAEIKTQKSEIDKKIQTILSGSSDNQIINTADSLLKDVFNRELYREHPYYYYRLVQLVLPEKMQQFLSKGIKILFPEMIPGLIFLELMDGWDKFR